MTKLIKLVFGLAVLFFAVIIAAVVILPLVISPNDYKPQIIEAVKQQTGRDLSIEGDIGLSVFPKVGLTLGKTELSNARGFKQPVFARVDAVNIQVALMPLLEKKVEMDEVVLDGLILNLHRNKQGVTNWDDLAKEGKKDRQVKDTEPGKMELAALAIGGVRIVNAQVRWQDDQKGQQYDITGFNLTSGELVGGKPVELELSSQFASSQPKVAGNLSMTTTILADVEQGSFVLDALKLVLQATGDMFPGGKTQSELAAAQVALQLNKQTLAVKQLTLNTMGMQVNGGLTGADIMSDQAQFNGQLQVQPFNPRDLIQALGQSAPDTADPGVLTRMSAGFNLEATPNKASLKKLQLKVDDTSMKGNLGVSQFDNPAITFDLDIDKIDLDRYLPKPAQDAKAQAASPSDSDAELFPVETLRKLNANGVARIGEVRKNNITARDVVVRLKANGGNVNLKPSAKLYEGTYDADVTVDARPQEPKLNVDARLSGVQIEPLLKDMQGEAKLAGRTDATVKVNAVGNTQTAVKKTLNGNAAFSFQDGALVGVNIAKLIREGWATVQGKSAPKTNEPDKTDFSELKGTARITNGVVDNRDFAMKSPLLRLAGEGTADLVREQLDYTLKASIVGSLQGQGGEDMSKLKGVTIPVKVTGPFSKPAYKPDLSAALSDSVKQKAKEKVEEKKEGIKQKLEEKIGDKLKGLFGR